MQERRMYTMKSPQGMSIPLAQSRPGKTACEFCDSTGHITAKCRRKRAYKERKRQEKLHGRGRVKEVRDGAESQCTTMSDTTNTSGDSDQGKEIKPKSPEGIERLEEELDVIPDFLNLGVRG